MPGNRFLGPAMGLTIRQPTDGSLEKGNIHNPPRYANKGMGGLNSAASAGADDSSPFAVKPPGATLRKMPNVDGENT